MWPSAASSDLVYVSTGNSSTDTEVDARFALVEVQDVDS